MTVRSPREVPASVLETTATTLLAGPWSPRPSMWLAAEQVCQAVAPEPPAMPARVDGLSPVRELGRGAMAIVYQALDERRGWVALKLALTARRSRAILRERRALELVGPRPGLVRLLGSGRVEERAYLLLDLVRGETLEQRGRRRGRLSVASAARALAPVAHALGELHALGVLHRDVKPANVLVGRDGRGLLIDLGLARLPGERDGSVAGTPVYMAPEQLQGGDGVDAAADVFGLGVSLYQVLAGRLPQAAPTLPDLLRLRHARTIRAVRDVADGVPPRLDALVMACLAPDPGCRPTAREVASSLEALLPAPGARRDRQRAA